jgi:hypothetical protein
VEAQVDAGSACVRLGDESWPFELDCRDGSALVEIGGRAARVRPLRWREKLSLARFAHLGTPFVEEQQLRIALDDAPVPSIEEERAALCALAVWVAAPGGEFVPFEPRALAGVTLDVCRAVGLKPGDLDRRDAYEVEALWLVAAGRIEHLPVAPSSTGGPAKTSSEPAPETWESELTRIEIVPDGASRADLEQPATATPPETEIDAPREEAAPPPYVPSPPEPRRRPRELAAVRDFAVLTSEAPLAALQEQPGPVAATLEEPALGSRGVVAAYASAPGGSTRAPVAEPALERTRPARLAASWPSGASRGAARPDEALAAAPAPQPRPTPVAAPEQDPERLFDELADGLERAASMLGVDLEA